MATPNNNSNNDLNNKTLIQKVNDLLLGWVNLEIEIKTENEQLIHLQKLIHKANRVIKEQIELISAIDQNKKSKLTTIEGAEKRIRREQEIHVYDEKLKELEAATQEINTISETLPKSLHRLKSKLSRIKVLQKRLEGLKATLEKGSSQSSEEFDLVRNALQEISVALESDKLKRQNYRESGKNSESKARITYKHATRTIESVQVLLQSEALVRSEILTSRSQALQGNNGSDNDTPDKGNDKDQRRPTP